MKLKFRITSVLLSFVLIFSCITLFNISAPTLTAKAESYTYVYTCKGNAVPATIYGELLDSANKTSTNNYYDAAYPNATRLRDSTTNYNCHSYAWYSQSTSNIYWIPAPESFLNDGTYLQTTYAVGDIIVYYNSNGIPSHSGIITGKSSNTLAGLTVTSKWGSAGLYSHPGNHCPYSNGTFSFKVYRLCVHSSSSHYYTKSNAVHVLNCNTCGVLKRESHSLDVHGICTVCGHKGSNIEINKYLEEEAS